MKHTQNIRALQSQRMIIDALIILLKTESYCNITITQIIQEAKLSRKTFYRNYKNKDEVLINYSNLLFDELLFSITNSKSCTSNNKIFNLYFNFWYEKQELLKLFYKSNMMNLILKSHFDMMEKFKVKAEVNDYKSSIIIGSCFTILIQWIKNDFNLSPLDITNIYSKNIIELSNSFIQNESI